MWVQGSFVRELGIFKPRKLMTRDPGQVGTIGQFVQREGSGVSLCLAVLVLVDVSDQWTRNQLSPQVLKCLSQFLQIPSILVLNKVNEGCGSL